MKVSKEFEYTMVNEIYSMCNREQYFTCGSNRQYSLMFDMAKKPEVSTRDLAVMIYTCSEDAKLESIQANLDSIMNRIEEYEKEYEEEQHSYDEVIYECIG
jgi:hypothetical protein